jgi:hypothetical protein
MGVRRYFAAPQAGDVLLRLASNAISLRRGRDRLRKGLYSATQEGST